MKIKWKESEYQDQQITHVTQLFVRNIEIQVRVEQIDNLEETKEMIKKNI